MLRRIDRNLLAVLLVAAAFPPVAFARPERSATPARATQLDSYQQAVAKSFGSTPGGLAGPTVRSASSIDGSADSARATGAAGEGFRWGDAGIGAAGVFLLLGAGGAAWSVARRRHERAAAS